MLLCATAALQAAGAQTGGSTPSGTGVQASATASSQGHDSFRAPEGAVLHVVLAKNVDPKKNEMGDEVMTSIVEDLTSEGKVVIPKDSKVIGHITQIQARGVIVQGCCFA